jgi:hypothetical protein
VNFFSSIGSNVARKHNSDNVFFDRNGISDFELGFIGAARYGLSLWFIHQSILTQGGPVRPLEMIVEKAFAPAGRAREIGLQE